MPYSHDPLESTRHIRVLTIGDSTDDTATIHVSLKQISLDDKDAVKSYDALSYVWGSGSSNALIICDGKPLLVTPNCHAALLELGQRRRHHASHALWIDAICIDQGSEEHSLLERNSQVKQMGDVYAKARKVIIWLGSGGGNSRRFYKKLRPAVRSNTLSAVFETVDVLGKAVVLPKTHTMMLNATRKGRQGLRELSSEELTDEERDVMTGFAQNPWFQRVWTLQEVSFSRDAVVMWGKATVSLSSLLWYALTTVAVGGSLGARCVPGLRDTLDNLMRRNATALMVDYHKKPDWGKALIRIALLGSDVMHALDTAFLEQLEELRATVEQDKVFGLFSSLTISGIQLPSPDYRKSTEMIFEETTVSWLRSRRRLDIFLFIGPRDNRLPSWVFDWYSRTDDERSHRYNLGKLLRLDPLYSRDIPRASAASHIGSLSGYQAGILPLKGFLIGHISSLLTYTNDHFSKTMDSTRCWINSLHLHSGTPNITSAFHRLLEPLVVPYAAVLGFDVSRFLHAVVTTQQEHEFRSWLEESQTAPIGKINSGATAHQDLNAFRKRMLHLVPFTLFVLDSGHVGIGAAQCLEGDAVYLLAGAPWPVVLRSVPGHRATLQPAYRYVAAVKVDGVMRGERWPKDLSSLEDICLV